MPSSQGKYKSETIKWGDPNVHEWFYSLRRISTLELLRTVKAEQPFRGRFIQARYACWGFLATAHIFLPLQGWTSQARAALAPSIAVFESCDEDYNNNSGIQIWGATPTEYFMLAPNISSVIIPKSLPLTHESLNFMMIIMIIRDATPTKYFMLAPNNFSIIIPNISSPYTRIVKNLPFHHVSNVFSR